MIWHFPATHPMSPLGISEYDDHHSDQQWPLHQTADIGMWLLYRVLILVWSLQCDVLVSAALQHVASDITLTWIRLNAKNGSVSSVLNTVCRTWGHGHMKWAAKLKSSQWKVKLSPFSMSCRFPPPTIARVIFWLLAAAADWDWWRRCRSLSGVCSPVTSCVTASWHVTRDMTASHPPDTHTSHWRHLSPLGRVWVPSLSHVQ